MLFVYNFMFYYSDRVAFYLPKRVLVGESDVVRVRSLVQERLPPEVPYLQESSPGRTA